MTTKIILSKNGPIIIKGEIELIDGDNAAVLNTGYMHLTLCRCGKSKQKPFCDGTHRSLATDEEGPARPNDKSLS